MNERFEDPRHEMVYCLIYFIKVRPDISSAASQLLTGTVERIKSFVCTTKIQYLLRKGVRVKVQSEG